MFLYSQHVRPSCPHSFRGHNFVVCCWIKILYGTNYRQNKTNFCAQNSGCYLQGQGHRATLKQIRFQAITLLFMVYLVIVYGTIDPHNIFHPLIVIFRGASINSTDILMYCISISLV